MRKPTSKQSKRDAIDNIPIVEGCGNVFEDLGLPDADILQVKATMAIYIWKIISERRLTQKQAAVLLGIDQPGVSDIMRGHLRGYSTDRLIRFLTTLGHDVEVVVTERAPSARRPGKLRVRNAVAPAPAPASRSQPRAASSARKAGRTAPIPARAQAASRHG
jgi:predicted XRE-type DNA-binding protein